ncbi:MAG TPA: aminotransferase class III-fold pyridoxal phosphate-dependent enzyme [Pirellulales bacterium]|nr:aminotransferase class III-fold pyridoxal phosphate-dependent enzyme [Pirellulales bacterium]
MSSQTSAIIDAYRRRTVHSARLAQQAVEVFPGGVTHDGRILEPYPIYVERAAGPRKWDVDGNEYVDYAGGHGALLLGHNHPLVVQAVAQQLQRGTHFGACHQPELEWGRWVQKLMPSAERVRFTSSGTEATMMAMRLARAFTGRPKIMRFLGHFHGWHDHAAFGVASHFDGTPTPGVLGEVATNVVLAPPGDVAGTRAVLDAHADIAAAIIEPTGASWGQVPVLPDFLEALRELTAERGVLLILDEVISGFRCSPGGAQQVYGIRPDLTTLAKILAGGLPGGAVVGRKEILGLLDVAEAAATGREKVPHQGTFNANPLSAVAGSTTLEIVSESDACQRANEYAARLREALSRVLRDERIPWVVYGSFSGFHVFTNPQRLEITAAEIEAGKFDHRVLKAPAPKSLAMKLRLGMMLHGVELFTWPGGPTSAVHTNDDLEQTADAFRQTIKLLRAEGEL